MNHYLFVYSPPRPTFIDESTAEEDAVVTRHFEYLKSLLAEDILILAGRDDHGTIGIAIIKADSIEQADRIMQNDPAVKASVFSACVKPFSLALCRES